MANRDELTRKGLVLAYLQRNVNRWVNGPELANEKVGGSEGLKRLRDLRQDGHRIVMRPHPDPKRDVFQYKLVVADRIHEDLVQRVMDFEPPKIEDPHLPERAEAVAIAQSIYPKSRPPLPMQYNKTSGFWEITQSVCVDCEGLYEDEAEHRQGRPHKLWEERKRLQAIEQQEIGVPLQPSAYKFTQLPDKISMDNATVCPRCKGHRRPGRKERFRRGRMIPATEQEDFCRDPFRPTVKGEPNMCERCGGYGIVPPSGL